MYSQQISGQQQQLTTTTSVNANAADVVCPRAEDNKPILGTAAAAGGHTVGYVGVQPNYVPMISSENTSPPQIFVDSYEVQQSKGLGYALIAIGVVSVIWHTVTIAQMNWGLISVGHGFWCGSVFMITGCVGVWAAGKVGRIVTAFYLLCILSVLLSICLFGLSVATADSVKGFYYGYWDGKGEVVRVMQSLLATTAVAAGAVSVRGIVICRRVIRLCGYSYTSAFGIPGAWHSSGLITIEQQLQQQMLQRQSQFLLQQLQPSPQTAAAHYPVVFMMPPQAPSPFGTPMYCQMPVPASQQQTLFSPTLQPLQTAMPSSNQGVVYMMIPAAAAATSSIGVPGSLVAAQSNGTTAPPPYPTAC